MLVGTGVLSTASDLKVIGSKPVAPSNLIRAFLEPGSYPSPQPPGPCEPIIGV